MKPEAFIRQLKTDTILLDSKGNIVPDMTTEKDLEKAGKRYISATCHYQVVNDGKRGVHSYYTKPKDIKQMIFMSPQGKGYYGISRILEYGGETEYSLNNLSGKWRLETEPDPEPETILASEIPFSERAEK